MNTNTSTGTWTITKEIPTLSNAGKYVDINGLDAAAAQLEEAITEIENSFNGKKDLGSINWKADAKATLEEGFTKISTVITEIAEKAKKLKQIASEIDAYKEAEKNAQDLLSKITNFPTTYSTQVARDNALEVLNGYQQEFSDCQAEMNNHIKTISDLNS